MAQITEVRLVDDVDGGPADETLEFGVDGHAYAIDLSAANAERLRDALALYVQAGRRTAAGPSATRPASKSARAAGGAPSRSARVSADREQNQGIRAWARSRGMSVSDRGRIPEWIVTAYNEHGQDAADGQLSEPELVSV